MRSPKAKRFKSILLFHMALIGIGVPMYELIFGNWIIQDNINKLNIIRDRTVTYTIGDLYESPLKTVTYTRDTFGLRGRFESPSEVVILTVGGSSTDQRYITDGETWQDVLQQEFRNAGEVVAVANAGVDGHSTFGHIKSFDDWFPTIPGLKPEYVLFYIGQNDLYIDEGYRKDTLVKQSLRERSAIYHAAKTVKGVFEAEVLNNIGHRSVDFEKREWTSEPLQTSYEVIMDVRLREYAERLEVLIQKTKSFGSTPIFVTQPSRKYRLNNGILEGDKEPSRDEIPINGVDYYYMTRQLDEATCSIAREHNVVCIDMAQEMAHEWEDDDFYDNSHMTPAGAKKVGEYLFGKLRDKQVEE
jgi:hypothetical protein